MVDAGFVVFQDLAYGILEGCVFAVVAHGLNLIWGVTKVVNVAHGEFIVLGAYGAYFLSDWFGFSPLLSAPIDALIGLGAGVLFYFGFLHRELRGKETVTLQTEMVTLVATFGLALFIVNLATSVFSVNPVGIPWNPGVVRAGSISLPVGSLEVAAISVAVIAATHVFLTRTYLGSAIRAYSQDIAAAQLAGINPTFVAAVATALGLSATMLGGALLTVWLPSGINPLMGQTFAPICFVTAAPAAPGKMWGASVGGLAPGAIIKLFPPFFGPSVGPPLALPIAFLAPIRVLLFAPEGIVR